MVSFVYLSCRQKCQVRRAETMKHERESRRRRELTKREMQMLKATHGRPTFV